jgi:cob(I)alamin adenosyltransferase
MSISTAAGDGGITGLAGGERLPKDHPRIEALGALDELDAFLGDVRALGQGQLPAITGAIQGDLRILAGILAAPARDAAPPDPARLEGWIRERDRPFRAFVSPGENPLSARLHIARTVCRRAERRLVSLGRVEPLPPPVLVYLNRLSDLLFLLAEAEAEPRRGFGSCN